MPIPLLILIAVLIDSAAAPTLTPFGWQVVGYTALAIGLMMLIGVVEHRMRGGAL